MKIAWREIEKEKLLLTDIILFDYNHHCIIFALYNVILLCVYIIYIQCTTSTYIRHLIYIMQYKSI